MAMPIVVPLILYLACFLILALLPGWRSLLCVAAAMVWPVWWSSAALLDMPEFQFGTGYVEALFALICWGIILGWLTGGLTRLVTLALRHRGRSRAQCGIITVAGFLSPFLIAGLQALHR